MIDSFATANMRQPRQAKAARLALESHFKRKWEVVSTHADLGNYELELGSNWIGVL
jgi:hypothetical protein